MGGAVGFEDVQLKAIHGIHRPVFDQRVQAFEGEWGNGGGQVNAGKHGENNYGCRVGTGKLRLFPHMLRQYHNLPKG
ncbi:hypothetical protein GCM10011495_25280 [Hymenobacter frigidus]|uniref:Uncharacterized protein n=1 Tax=Hymenobacter frigidus TaxID=1524095 RepID=A0ABQ2A8Z5_9BACT|nr:hypothetical protein GCM10011495_25280 [Hymenobacter frigidus]